jgi:hypothetical protein
MDIALRETCPGFGSWIDVLLDALLLMDWRYQILLSRWKCRIRWLLYVLNRSSLI